jgi:hypothetical protein
MRESRTYGSVRGACDETHVPTATGCLAATAHSRLYKYDLRPALTNVRNWESNGLNAHVAFGPFMTQGGH